VHWKRLRMKFAAALALPAAAGLAGAPAAEPPKIANPRPVPPDLPPDMPPLPPAAIDDDLSIGGDDVDARKVETRMTVEVAVNGHGPYHFVVDSGADTSVVGLRIAHDLQLPLTTPVVLNSMTSRDIVDRVKVDALTLGPSTIENLELPALRERDLGGDGMIGIDALVQQRLMMDFEKRLIKVEDAFEPVQSLPGDIVVTARRQRGQLILTEVRVGRMRVDAVIDTGSQITIGNRALRDQLMRSSRDNRWTVATTGVTGRTADLELGRIRSLGIGSISLTNVPIAFADVPPFEVFGLDGQPSLLIGTDILENFQRVSLDFHARKVRFQLKRCAAQVTIATSYSPVVSRLASARNSRVCSS
jgi:hypothetical protein